jgi:hypothetical protein
MEPVLLSLRIVGYHIPVSVCPMSIIGNPKFSSPQISALSGSPTLKIDLRFSD